ncbi:hypothetical protein ONZ43_g6958 [Nemania bipapillata]|uniref:Uncharacterized protein n=1 Tax=Nemania bipapillata TaxID=110536 RepID=A0ACC2HUI0_9PEZI|nr:hypothetical protein ONZ43_g6958 [Nemania bipapillata]
MRCQLAGLTTPSGYSRGYGWPDLEPHSLSDPLSHRNLRGSPIYKGTLRTMQHIVRHEGITGLWKGNVPAELMYVSYAAVQFTAYRSMTMLLHRLSDEENRLPHAAESFISGATAGATATATTYPLDLLRTRFAAQGNDRIYTSLPKAILEIRRDEGIKGFFRGLSPGLAQIVPLMGIFFAVYETARLPLGQLDLPWGSGDATAGIIASVIAKTGVFPLDLKYSRICGHYSYNTANF